MKRAPAIDLGADKTRMKDPRDVERQNRTVDVILDRFFNTDPERCFELQVLADEVGMGKTFVALAVAYSMLEARRQRTGEQPKTRRGVLVLTPPNDALFRKWNREVGEFVKRCFPEELREEATARFHAESASRPDELVARLISKGGKSVVVAKTSVLGAQVRHADTKTRIVLGALFTAWGPRFRKDARERLLKGAKERAWPKRPEALADLDDRELEHLPIPLNEITRAVRRLVKRPRSGEPDLEKLLEKCKEASEPYVRGRDALFTAIRSDLIKVYKAAAFRLLARRIPLVIVDEAHNWKNGPSSGSYNYRDFERWIAPRCRRALLLTATPFQLRPDEMLELLKISDVLALPHERRERLRLKREEHIAKVLQNSAQASTRFSKAWSRLGRRLGTTAILELWNDEHMQRVRADLTKIADRPGALRVGEIEGTVDEGIRTLDPTLRDFFREALRLHAYNRDLSQELGELVIRHRRHTEHRLVRVGAEVHAHAATVAARPDSHTLHAAPGVDVRGEAELPIYLVMRATSELEGGKRTASLGSSLTGCYSTLFASADGRKFGRTDASRAARVYVDALRELVGDPRADAKHPKVQAMVNDTVQRWEKGEKTLVFSVRTKTAHRLRDLLQEAIQSRLEARRKECLGGPGSLRTLRARLTGKDRDLIPLVLDRVLWSMLWAPPGLPKAPFGPEEFRPRREDYDEIARLSLSFDIDLSGKTVDRVFLNRAAECAQARRLARDVTASRFHDVLEQIADESWVTRPYGEDLGQSDDGATAAIVDERGVHSVYEAGSHPTTSAVSELARALLDRDAAAKRSGQTSVLRTAFLGPSLWLGKEPDGPLYSGVDHAADVEVDPSDLRFFHVQLGQLTWAGASSDFRTRAHAMRAVRRAALREALLVRLLPTAEQRDEESWAELLAEHFTLAGTYGEESMLRRLGVFLEDLASASGSIEDPQSARGALHDATRLRDETAVALVTGDTHSDARDRIFGGFNSPLIPEILVCTQVGQEGIDLHRHCKHVVHYDLVWNPAILEQRTGRTDRIGCAALRERRMRERGLTNRETYLEVDVPYLAGTYDERMFEELRLRAQTFEVLTGGDLAADHIVIENEEEAADMGAGEKAAGLVSLPLEMVAGLRVNLAVWQE